MVVEAEEEKTLKNSKQNRKLEMRIGGTQWIYLGVFLYNWRDARIYNRNTSDFGGIVRGE